MSVALRRRRTARRFWVRAAIALLLAVERAPAGTAVSTTIVTTLRSPRV